MSKVISLKCPNCGSNLDENSRQCRYCASSFIIDSESKSICINGISCKRCGETNGNEEIFCKRCGDRIRINCRNCDKSILNKNIKCPYCGVSNYSESQSKSKDSSEKDYQNAICFRDNKNFAEADKLFKKTENDYMEKPDFYIEWIRNYVLWGMSFDSDITMHNFSTIYRDKAFETYKILENKFPNNSANKSIFEFINSNRTIKYEKKGGCFIATAVYGNPDCKEVIILKEWRERHLRNRAIGEVIIKQYNCFGPYLAKIVQKNYLLKKPFLFLFNYIIKKTK